MKVTKPTYTRENSPHDKPSLRARGVNTKQIFSESIRQVKGEMTTRLEQEVEQKLSESVTEMLQRAPVLATFVT